MDITTERPKVAFVFDQFRRESSLEQVACPLMSLHEMPQIVCEKRALEEST
jgi:hypothetical protein